MFKENINLEVYIDKELTSCLVIINLDVGRLRLIYFRINCFNFKDFNLYKHFERKMKDLLFAPQLFDLTKCPKCMFFTLRDQTAAS